MFKSNLATYPQTSGRDTYANNLGRAARVFLAALLAAKPVDREVVVTERKMSERTRAKSIAKLYRLAGGYDSISPSLAAELRFIAGQD
jgi:hypothetical protein